MKKTKYQSPLVIDGREDNTGHCSGPYWTRNPDPPPFPKRQYGTLEGRDITILDDFNGTKVLVLDNDPTKAIFLGENHNLGPGTIIQYLDRYIAIQAFRRGDEAFENAKSSYNTGEQLRHIVDLFHDENAMAFGEEVKRMISSSPSERDRIMAAIGLFQHQHGDEAEVVLVRSNLQVW